MGNRDGLVEAFMAFGTNEVIKITKEMYFSFAFNDEIALVKNGSFYILNCSPKLWRKVKKQVIKLSPTEIVKWWYNIRKSYEISDWSNDFAEIEKEIRESDTK